MKRQLDMLGAALGAAILLAVGHGVWLWAAPMTVPHTFAANTSLPAPWLNDNFSAAQTAINSIDANQINTSAVGNLEIAADAVTTAKILDANVTTGKLAIGATLNNFVSISAVASLSVFSSEAVLGTLPTFTARGGRVILFGKAGLSVFVSGGVGAQTATLRLYRKTGAGAFTLIASWNFIIQTLNGSDSMTSPIPVPEFSEVPSAAGQIYEWRVFSPSGTLIFQTPGTFTGVLYAAELG